MPSSGQLRAGRAFIELGLIGDDKVQKALKALQSKVGHIGSAFTRVGAAAGALGGVITATFIPAINAASDAQESLNKFGAVFAAQTNAASKYAEQLANSVGRSSIDIKNGMSAFQGFFVGLGFGGDKAREFSQQLSALALDFGSFHNLSDEESMQRFISALSGSSEVLDMFGINIKQAALEQELFRMGIRKSWQDVSEQEKTLARLNVIMKAMTDQGAVGDAAKTAGSFANQMKRLQGELKDTAIAVGNAVLPAVTGLLNNLNTIIPPVVKWIELNPKLTAGVAAFGVALAVGGTILGTFGVAILGAVSGATALLPLLAAIVSPAGLLVVALGALSVAVVAIAADFVDWSKVLRGVKSELQGVIGYINTISKMQGIANNFSKNMQTLRNGKVTHNFGNVGTGMGTGFFAPTPNLPAMNDLAKKDSNKRFWASQSHQDPLAICQLTLILVICVHPAIREIIPVLTTLPDRQEI